MTPERRQELKGRSEEIRNAVLRATSRRSRLYHAFLYISLALVVWMISLWRNPPELDAGEPRALAPGWDSVTGILDGIAAATQSVFGTIADGLKWALPKATEGLVTFALVEEPVWLVGLLGVALVLFVRRGQHFRSRDRAAQDARKHILEEWSETTGNNYVMNNAEGRVAARPVRLRAVLVKGLGLVLVLLLVIGSVWLSFHNQGPAGPAMTILLIFAAPAAAFLLFGSVLFRLTGRNPGPRPLNNRREGYAPKDVVADWSGRDLDAERRFLIVDLFFPPVYGAAFLVSLGIAARYFGWALQAWWAIPVLVVLIADWIENLVQLGQLKRYRRDGDVDHDRIRLASKATRIKCWGVLLLVIAICLLALLVLADGVFDLAVLRRAG